MKYDQRIVSAYFQECGLPKPVFEHRFHPVRRWRFDVAFLDSKVALEIQGGIFTHGRHVRGAALLKEWEKLNTAAGIGWRVLFCQPKDVCSSETIRFLKMAIGEDAGG